MIYSVNGLQSVADCNTMLNMANNDKLALQAQKAELLKVKAQYAATAVDVQVEIPVVQAELAAKTAILASTPEGHLKEKYRHQVRKWESKLFVLQNKQASYGPMAVMDKEWELGRVERDLVEMEVYITAIQDRINELEGRQ